VLVWGASGPVTAVDGSADRVQSRTTADQRPRLAATATTETIDLSQELRLTPDRPGEIDVVRRYHIPEAVVKVQARVPADATVLETTGFVARDDGYAWDGQTDAPSLRFSLPVNETIEQTGPISGAGQYAFVDAGSWAIVRIPRGGTGWSWTGGGTVSLSRSTTTAGPGAVGADIAYLGPYTEFNRTAADQRFRLIVPERARLAEFPAAIFDSFAAAARTLQVGDRDAEVLAIAAPTNGVQWGVRGLQTGDTDMWVRDTEPLNSSHNVWIHEYVHTRQAFTTEPDARWLTESSATYYAALFTLQQRRIDFEAFQRRLSLGTVERYRTAILADPSTWNTVAPYTKGTLVAGDLDRRLRQTTARRSSLQDVFARLNARDEPISAATFRTTLRGIGGDATVSETIPYLTTAATPPVWNRSTHASVFGTLPARIGYLVPESPSYEARGPYRNATLDATAPVELAVGETLEFDVLVRNTGGEVGAYDARLLVNGAQKTNRNGTLAPNATKRVTFTQTFARAGEYTLSVEGEQIAVSVREPATPRVTGLTVAERQTENGTLTVRADLTNEQAIPAVTNLTLSQNDVPVGTRRVVLGPGESRRVTFTGVSVAPGTHVFRVGNRTVSVTVSSPTTTTPATTPANGAGFGALVAVCAVIGGLLARTRR
jgi:hypothetical protein